MRPPIGIRRRQRNDWESSLTGTAASSRLTPKRADVVRGRANWLTRVQRRSCGKSASCHFATTTPQELACGAVRFLRRGALIHQLVRSLVLDLVLHSSQEPVLAAVPPEGIRGAVVEHGAAVQGEGS